LLSVLAGEDPTVSPAKRTAIRGELRSWQVESVIVGPMAHQAEAVRLLTTLIGRDPTVIQDVYLWRDLQW
jgi:hypothetical protein